MDDVRALQDIRYDPCLQPAPPQGSRLTSGSLALVAADAPLRRADLEDAVRGLCQPGAWFPLEEQYLGTVLRRLGVREWALAEVTLRR